MAESITETIARAIADGIGDDFDHAHRNKPHWIETRGESGGRYRAINEPRQPDYIDAAQAAITALTEAGYAILPVEPDVDLLMSMAEHYDFAGWPSAYRAMIEAATPDHIMPAIQTVGPLDSEKGE